VNDNQSTEDTPDEDVESEELSLHEDAIELPDAEEESGDSIELIHLEETVAELDDPEELSAEDDDFGALLEHYGDDTEPPQDVESDIPVESVEEVEDEAEEEVSTEADITLGDAEAMAEDIAEVEELSDEVGAREDNARSAELELELNHDRPVVLSDTLPDDSAEVEFEEDDEVIEEFIVEEEYEKEKEYAEPEVEEEHILADTPKSRILWLIFPIAIMGILTRIVWYIKNPAFALDEADVTSELLSRRIPELFQVLGEHQCAPIAYLLTVKFSTKVFGSGEYALRAYPLIATILGLVFFAWLACRMVEPLAAVLATSIVAFSWPVIQYAAEFKQYGNDVMASALMLAVGYTYLSKPMSKKHILFFAILGAVLQWFSLPVLFVLAGVGLTLGVQSLVAREWGKVKGLLLVAAVWLASFGLNYFVSLKDYAAEDSLRAMHYESYFLIPPERAWPTMIRWVGETSMTLFSNPVGIILPGLGLLTFVLGVFVMARTQRAVLSMLLLPLLGVVLASMAQHYPFYGRFLQFLVPSLAICCAVGLSGLLQLLWTARRRAAVFLGILFFIPSIAVVVNHLIKSADQGLRPVVSYWQEHVEVEDLSYIDHWVRNEFKYYTREQEGIDAEQMRVGISRRNDWSNYESIINEYLGNDRVWFILQDHDWHLSIGERQFFETRLSALGEQLDHKVWGEYHLYLYDLSLPEVERPPLDDVPKQPLAIDESTPDSDLPADSPSDKDIEPSEVE